MLDTGFPRADAENDFARERRHQVLATLAHRLRREPHDIDRLLTLDEVVAPLGWRGQRYLGLQTIRLDTIVGTVDSRHDFDRHFRPTSNRVRSRWEQLALAQRRGAAVPPIEVYRIGDRHFVNDGHHRVSIAAATGQQTIDAYVTEVLTTLPPTGTTRPGDLTRQLEPLNGPSAGSAAAAGLLDGLTEARGEMAHAPARPPPATCSPSWCPFASGYLAASTQIPYSPAPISLAGPRRRSSDRELGVNYLQHIYSGTRTARASRGQGRTTGGVPGRPWSLFTPRCQALPLPARAGQCVR